MDDGQPVVIFRNVLGLYSETFILAQAAALRRFTPTFLASRITQQVPTMPPCVSSVNTGGIVGKGREYIFRRWGIAPDVRTWLTEQRPRLIHAHFGPDGATILSMARELNIPLVVTYHGYDATTTDDFARTSFRAHRWYVPRRRELQQYASRFIAVSSFIRDRMIERGYPEDRVTVHYIGIDTANFTPDPSVERERTVLFVGRLVEKKGCALLLDAMQRVQATDPTIRLVIIGDGSLQDKLHERARQHLRNVEFLGPQPPDVVRSWMNRARVFSVPSITASNGDSEAFGMVFAEAQSMGLPVASFAHGGIPEVVTHGQTGLLAPEGDVETLATNILTLLTDDDLWNAMSAAGPEHIRQNFDIHQQTRLLEDIYAEAASS